MGTTELDLSAPADTPVFVDHDAVAEPASAAGPGVRTRRHVMVDRGTWAHFHKRLAEIEREWRGGSPESSRRPPTMTLDMVTEPGLLDGLHYGVRAAREELRAEIARLAPDFPGGYLVPV